MAQELTEGIVSIVQTFLAEFEQQAPITRRFLERLPEDKLAWKPHRKSRSAGQLALHLAAVPGPGADEAPLFVQQPGGVGP